MMGKRPFTEAEFKRIIAAADVYFMFPVNVREKTIWSIQAATGLRINEVLQLTLRDAFHGDQIAEVINVRRKYVKGKREGRFIPLAPFAREALADYMIKVKPWVVFEGPGAPLWVSRIRENGIANVRNVAPTDKTVRLHLKKVCTFCGIENADVSTHSWRKLFAKRVYEKLGFDLIGTQKALGHSSIKSTIHYLNTCDSTVDEAIKALWDDLGR
jgi:integrase